MSCLAYRNGVQEASFINEKERRLAYRLVAIQLPVIVLGGIYHNLGFEWNYRLSVVLALVVCIIFSPFLVAIFLKFIQRAKWYYVVIVFYFVLHPFVVWALVETGMRELPLGIGKMDMLASSFAWQIAISLVVVIATCWTKFYYERFVRLLWRIAFIVAIEGLVEFFLLGKVFNFEVGLSKDGRFEGILVGSNFYAGCLGLILYGLSVYYAQFERKAFKYKAGLVLGSLLVLASLERSVIVSWILLNLMLCTLRCLKGWRIRRPEAKVVLEVCTALMVLFMASSVILLMGWLRPEALSTGASFHYRVMKWARGIEIGNFFFPLGSGGSLAGKYNTSRMVPQLLQEKLLDLGGVDASVLKVFRVGYTQSSGEFEHKRISLHNTHIELYAEFGLVGLLVAAAVIYYPTKYLWAASRRLSSTRNRGIFASAILASLLLSLQVALLMISTGHVFLWIIIALHLYMREAAHRYFVG